MQSLMAQFAMVTWFIVGFATHCLGDQEDEFKQPNVIIVMTDDQGYGEFSCHGNPIAMTPHIDQLAAESMRLTDFHVSPMCTPTRGQLLTGLDAFRNGAINVSSGRTLLRPELATMGDIFLSSGYRTGLFGKWHLGDNFPFRPEDRGFEETLWFPSSHVNSVPDFWDNDYFDDTYIRNGERVPYDGYCTDLYFDEAYDWIKGNGESQDDRPFFAYIALNAAHWPWFVPDHFRDRVREDVSLAPEVLEGMPERRRQNLISFLAMGANIDDNIGRMMDRLEEIGIADDTIVIFLTDNGSTMGPEYFNAGMRGKKTTLWEGGHRVPCFIRWPNGEFGQPREVDQLSHVQDLLPTLVDLCDLDFSIEGIELEKLDGVSIGPVLRGERDRLDDRMLVINYSRMPTFNVTYTDGNPAVPQRDGAAVLWGDWRLLENRMLFNVASDRHQDNNIADQHPEVVEAMQAHLQSWWDEVEETVLEPQRVVIGSTHENPMMLTACEWLDVFVDQQVQIRRGVRKNGVWHLNVAEAGQYRFELARWPKESELKLSDSCPVQVVTDGQYVAGNALPIRQGALQIGSDYHVSQPNLEQTTIEFELDLSAGPIELQTYMLDENEEPICGAYYLYVTRLEN